MSKFKQWLFRLLLSGAEAADVNKDGFVEWSVKVNIETKEVTTEIK